MDLDVLVTNLMRMYVQNAIAAYFLYLFPFMLLIRESNFVENLLAILILDNINKKDIYLFNINFFSDEKII